MIPAAADTMPGKASSEWYRSASDINRVVRDPKILITQDDFQFRCSWQNVQSRLARLDRWQFMQPPIEMSVSRNNRSRSATLPWQVSQVAPVSTWFLWLNRT